MSGSKESTLDSLVMAFDARIPGATSDERHYEDGLHVAGAEGPQAVHFEGGLHVVPPSPYRSSQGTFERASYPPSDPKAYAATAEKNDYDNAIAAPAVESRRIWGLQRRTFWILFAIFAIIIIAAGIGGGVGAGLSHNKQDSSTVTAPSISQSPTSAIALSSATRTTSSIATGTSKPGYCAKLVPNWLYQEIIAAGIGKDGYGVQFADLNGDGRVEYLYVDDYGAVTAFLNLGSPDPNPLNAGKVGWLNQGVIATGVGGLRAQIRFADLNGDGKADYIWVHDDGSADAWLNLGGPNDGADAAKVTWAAQGTIFPGFGKDGAHVVFADVDGDGRADYLWYNFSSGDVIAYLNTGPKNSNPTQAGQVGWDSVGIIATGFTVDSGGQALASARFADMNGDGRMDYWVLSYVNGNVSVWLNEGNNQGNFSWKPTGIIASGVGDDGRTVQFGDLNGDGRWDYLDVNLTNGAVTAWLNGC